MTPRVEEAIKAPVVVSAAEKVEEADAMRPPKGFKEKTVLEAASWTRSADPVWPVKVRSARFVAVVEVAAMVATARTSAVVVPTARLSVTVVRCTKVPASVHPAPLVIEAHVGFAPAPWVWRNWPEVPGARAAIAPAPEK